MSTDMNRMGELMRTLFGEEVIVPCPICDREIHFGVTMGFYAIRHCECGRWWGLGVTHLHDVTKNPAFHKETPDIMSILKGDALMEYHKEKKVENRLEEIEARTKRVLQQVLDQKDVAVMAETDIPFLVSFVQSCLYVLRDIESDMVALMGRDGFLQNEWSFGSSTEDIVRALLEGDVETAEKEVNANI